MRPYLQRFTEAFRKGDLILLLLCVVATAFGCLMIASATNASYDGALHYLVRQIPAALLGILAYIVISSIDAEFFSEHRFWLVICNVGLLLLLIPFGQTISGNRSWLNFPFLPFNIQPAEICKILYILTMASVMTSRQNKLSSVPSVIIMVGHLALIFGTSFVISSDMGVSLIFIFIFIGMTWAGGVNFLWFAGAGAALAVFIPIVWNIMPDNYMKLRIAVLFDPSLDPLATGPLYHPVRAMRSLTGGGLTGQGLFQGHRTQTQGALFAQHTDYIFAAIGEELGFVGCALVLILLCAIVARCIWVGLHSQDMLRRLICFGAASALIFQTIVNVGMCLGVMPVIGLTLPFISYGGSSIITLYAMLGLVSGVYARPAPASHERYIRPPREHL
ncbi:MAG: FtsW/RodA/SpoVE family cell cycle protein [Oscillospiraceae bacterium]|nr:FtsW/RodA/SpoVE family cell cycle protein [Oscillospiraceae bacterium]